MNKSSSIYVFFKKSTTAGILNAALSGLAVLFCTPIIIRSLGISGYGIWTSMIAFVGWGGVIDCGLTRATAYFMARTDQPALRADYLSSLLLIRLLSMLFTIPLLLSGITIWLMDGSNILYRREVIVAGSCLLLLAAATDFLKGALEGVLKLPITHILSMLSTIGNFGLVSILAIYRVSILVLLIASVWVWFLIFILHIYAAYKAGLRIGRPHRQYCREIILYAMPVFGSSVIYAPIDPISRFLVIALAGNGIQFGIYDLSLRLAHSALSLLTVVAIPIFPIVVQESKHGLESVKKLISSMTIVLSILYIIGNLLFLVFGKYVLLLIISKDFITYPKAWELMAVTLAGISLAGVSEPHVRSFLALGMPKTVMMLRYVQPATYMIVVLLLADILPEWRFSLGMSLSYAVTALFFIFEFHRRFGFTFNVIPTRDK